MRRVDRGGSRSGAAAEWVYVGAEVFWPLYEVVPEAWQRVLALARFAALTREDVLRLRWRDVHLAEREIRIRWAKTGVPQHTPIDPTLCDLLTAWAKDRAALLKLVGDQVVEPESVYVGNIGRDFRVWCRRAGVPFYAKPLRTLRKRCILNWARIQPSLQVLKLWAGHTSVVTTQTYYDQARSIDMQVGKSQRLLAAPFVPKLHPKPSRSGAVTSDVS